MSSSSPSRRRRVLATLAVAVVVLAACSKKDGGDDAEAPRRGTSTTASTPPSMPVVRLTPVGLDDNGTRGPDEATQAAVRQAVEGWIASAVIAPLATGAPAGDLAPYFTATALERLADPPTRATVVDEGLPPADRSITPEVATVQLASVAGPDEVVALVAARVDIKVRALGKTMDVVVAHQGELVLVPDGGGWKIESFALRTTRDSTP